MRKNLFSMRGMHAKELAKLFWEEIRADDVFGRAAQLAYYFFLALFPFLIFVVASLSMFGVADRGRALLFALFARILPGPASALVTQTFAQIIAAGGPLKMSFGILISLWSASMGMSAVMDTLNTAYRVTESRSFVKQYAVAIGLTLGLGILMVIFTALSLLGQSAEESLALGEIGSVGWHVAAALLGLALIFFSFACVYYFAPDLKQRHWHWITPGAVAGVVLMALVSLGLRLYLRYWSSYDATYGSLGAVIILLLSFYLSGLAVLSGGALNGVLENAPAAREEPRKKEERLRERPW